MDKKEIVLNNLNEYQLNILKNTNNNLNVTEDGTFSFDNGIYGDGYYKCDIKVINDGVIMHEFTEGVSGPFEEYTPYTYTDTFTIKNVDDINFVGEISHETNLYDNNKESVNKQFTDSESIMNNSDELIADIKNGLSGDELKQKYNFTKIENQNSKNI